MAHDDLCGGEYIRGVPSSKMSATEAHMSPATASKYAKDPVWAGVLARFPLALREVAKVSAWGTKKHEVPIDDMSFLTIPDAYRVYSDACGRHLLDEAVEGPVNAADGGLLHPAQLAWDALARLEVYLRGQEKELK